MKPIWMAVLFSMLPMSQVGSQSLQTSDDLTQAAYTFVEAMTKGEPHILAGLGTDPFTFDGRVIHERNQIMKFWERLFTKHGEELSGQTDARINIFNYRRAVEKFGKPPSSWSHINLQKAMFAAVTFKNRNGFLLILSQNRQDGWRVTALTD